MLSTSDFRKGLRLKIEDELYYIVDFQHARTAQRKAFVRTKLKNLRTGQVLEKTFASGEMFEKPDFSQKTMQFMYRSGEEFHFMDGKNFEQIILSNEQTSGGGSFLIEGNEYDVLFFEGNPTGLELPASVILKVTSTEQGVKGDSVTNITKPATLESGLEIKVPLFIKVGDLVKVDTRSNEYLERVQSYK
ncbi:MAG: elongation factor P [candidate division Zixibacteria bacterium]|nr:elongation factor P [candidate division Zixibacteria bacterium]